VNGALAGPAIRTSDAALLTRLRDLALVDVDSLLAGAGDSQYRRLLTTFAADLQHALDAARARMAELLALVGAGPDPLAVVDLPAQRRAGDAGQEAGVRATTRLAERAIACRALAIFDDLTGQLLPKLLELDRRSS
jgi:hypothetical protein